MRAHRGFPNTAALGLTALLLAGCVATPSEALPGSETTETAGGASTSAVATPLPTSSPFPIGPSVSTTALPDDCRAILSGTVVTELEHVPLNAPGMGGGIRPDSSRVCVWGEPGALATRLVTVIGYSPEREALDALFALANDGFTCYEPSGGVRCEKTWTSDTLSIEQGRTLFYRDGVIVDTEFSNLAPVGYTTAIIRSLWPEG
ncbi:hypothetical protein [Microbacterium sp.]|uniref:hypothetical protein n=1 Tax=Microbacterium sp. TaxID=51671 RepID=UPI0025CEEF37|nr:hypothetical protein [Microbacterium sp.]